VNGYIYICLLLLGLNACDLQKPDDSDPLLASVHHHELRLSKARKYISAGASEADSLSQLRGYVELWVREVVLLYEAEQHFPAEIDINDLVLDYRHSLIISDYENNLGETMLDTVISNDELQAYYQKNKDQYQLERPIVRAHFVKLHNSTDSLLEFRKWWDSKDSMDFQQLIAFSNSHADVFMLEDSTWYKVEEIESLMPPGTWRSENMRAKTSLRFTDDQYEYYLRISESVLSTEIAPLSYIREQAVRYIMHKRKLDLLETIKTDLYDREMRGKHINIFVK
jgi:hypothetical protein